MKIHVEFEVTPRVQRALALAAVSGVLVFAAAAARAQPTAIARPEHVNRATVTASGMIESQNGAWLAHFDAPTPGTMVLSFAPGAFAAAPGCVWSVLGTEVLGSSGVRTASQAPPVTCLPATPTSITCQSKGQYNLPLSLICMGP